MSDILEGGAELLDESVDQVESASDAIGDEVGLTSDETSGESGEKKSLLSSMTIYDAMLLVALVCVTLATLNLFFELRLFGDFPGEFPWRTEEVTGKK
jgi:hypothetical protein